MLRKLAMKLLFREKADSASFIRYMRKKGARVGDGTTIFSPRRTLIDMTRPWLIDIGENVQITYGVTILTHGYDWSVLKGVYGEILGSAGAVHIGNNVFIGMHTTILKGVHIGNNVIIGANSLVNKDIPDDCVVAGNPAKPIMTLQEYYEKRKKRQLQEARELVQKYREHYGKEPDENALSEFFWLFSNGSEGLHKTFQNAMKLVGNEAYSYHKLAQNQPLYKSMEDFLNSVQ